MASKTVYLESGEILEFGDKSTRAHVSSAAVKTWEAGAKAGSNRACATRARGNATK